MGQSEIAVAGMTDLFVLLQLPNAGDELQAIKKGVMELADLVVINKADIDETAATRARAQITSALGLIGRHRHTGPAGHAAHPAQGSAAWHPEVMQLSALQGSGVGAFWQAITRFQALQTANGGLAARRHAQDQAWMWQLIDAGLKQRFTAHAAVRQALTALSAEVGAGQVAASVAARRLLGLFH